MTTTKVWRTSASRKSQWRAKSSRNAALHGCYLLWAPLRTWNVGKRKYKTNWRLRARPRAHFASALLPQFAYDLLVDSFSPTGKRAGWRCRLVADGFVGERYPCEMCRKECWEKAPRPRLEAFEQYLQLSLIHISEPTRPY